jgi:hypothetical protein
MRTSEPALAERADSYHRIPRGESARRAVGHAAADIWLWLALLLGPLAVLVGQLAPSLRESGVAAALVSLVIGGVALGSLPAPESAVLVRRRRLALAAMVVAIVSMFLIARAGG